MNKPAAPELAVLPVAWTAGRQESPADADSFWVSLRYFNAYRIAVAALFLVSALIYGDMLSAGAGEDVRLFEIGRAHV